MELITKHSKIDDHGKTTWDDKWFTGTVKEITKEGLTIIAVDEEYIESLRFDELGLDAGWLDNIEKTYKEDESMSDKI